jgi:uncharacterized membrane protein
MTTLTASIRPVPRWLAPVSLGLGALAVGLSSYLTVTHYIDPAALACPDRGVVNCTLVTTSSWSVIAGVPVALLGLLWSLAMMGLMLPRFWRARTKWLDAARLGAACAGVGMVLYLIYVELFKVGAICLWCTGVHVTAVALFAVILAARPLLRREAASG